MHSLEELKQKFKIYSYLHGGDIPDVAISLYESHYGQYTDERTFLKYFNELLIEILESPNDILLFPRDKINFKHPDTFKKFRDDLLERFEKTVPYFDNDRIDDFLSNCFNYPEIFDEKIRGLSKHMVDTFYSLLLKYCFKEYNDEILKSSDIDSLKNWKSIIDKSKSQIQFIKDEIHITPSKRHVREYKDYCKALRDVVKVRSAEINASISNSGTKKNSNIKTKPLTKTFEERFKDKSEPKVESGVSNVPNVFVSFNPIIDKLKLNDLNEKFAGDLWEQGIPETEFWAYWSLNSMPRPFKVKLLPRKENSFVFLLNNLGLLDGKRISRFTIDEIAKLFGIADLEKKKSDVLARHKKTGIYKDISAKL